MIAENKYCLEIQAEPFEENWTETMREHAASCPNCLPYVASCAEIRSRLQSMPRATATMPQNLRDKMMDQLAAATGSEAIEAAANRKRPQRSPSLFSFTQRLVVPIALAASLVLGVFLEKSFEFGTAPIASEVERNIGMYIEDVTHDHYLLKRIGRPLEVGITNGQELADWLSHSLSFKVKLPRQEGSFSLQGGRVWHTVGRLSSLAAYSTADGGQVVLFAVPSANLLLAGAESEMIGTTRVYSGQGWGHEARVWFKDDLAYALTTVEGELPAEWSEIFLP